MLSLDISQYAGNKYLICVDRYSVYPTVGKLGKKSSTDEAIKLLQGWYRTFGYAKRARHDDDDCFARVAESVAPLHRRCEPSKNLVSQSHVRERWLTRLLLIAQNAFERERLAHKALELLLTTQNMPLSVAKR